MIGRFSLFAVLAVALVAEAENVWSPATTGEFSYQVSLKINGLHHCSGALVGYQHVVTSAKCVMDVDDISKVIVVTSSLSSINGGTAYTPRKIVSHPDFKRGTTGPHDIAIIALKDEIQYNVNQYIAFLPSRNTPSGVVATLTGWKWNTVSEGSEMENLMKLTVKTKDCSAPIVDGPRNICASVESGSVECTPDTGSPLVSDRFLIGINSNGNPCDEGTSGVFTNVFHHIDWIFKTIENS